jgi:hypothetical protein
MDQESGYLWSPIGGQAGSAASITAFAGGLATVTGLTGMAEASVLHVLTLGAAAAPGNIGTFQIVQYVSATSVIVANANGSAPDANNGTITWTESTLALAFPETVGVPDDGDAWDAAEFAPGYLGLLQRTAFLSYGALQVMSKTFTSGGNLAVPPGCNWMFIVGCGGGGGGEGGSRGETGSTSAIYPQGGGGAGAPAVTGIFPTTPGEVLHVQIGAGGAGGAGGGGAGADGGPSAVYHGSVVTWDITAPGGRGCGCGLENWSGGDIAIANTMAHTLFSDNFGAIAPGAIGVATGRARPFPFGTGPTDYQDTGASMYDTARWEENFPYRGGSAISYGASSATSLSSAGGDAVSQLGQSIEPAPGGTPGARGAGSGSIFGGIGGGGGGASLGGQGGPGGAGGAANGSGAGADGAAGGSGTGSTYGGAGTGGGGGGCGGDGSTSGGSGGAGGAGTGGIVILYWLQSTTPTAGITTP